MIEWDEPFSHDPLTNLHCSMTREDAIKYQRAYVEHNATDGFMYKNDQEALDDFMTVRWARDTGESR